MNHAVYAALTIAHIDRERSEAKAPTIAHIDDEPAQVIVELPPNLTFLQYLEYLNANETTKPEPIDWSAQIPVMLMLYQERQIQDSIVHLIVLINLGVELDIDFVINLCREVNSSVHHPIKEALSIFRKEERKFLLGSHTIFYRHATSAAKSSEAQIAFVNEYSDFDSELKKYGLSLQP